MIHQNTPEWLEMRQNHIGASDAPVIMQVSPWKTPMQLWEEKLGLREGFVTNPAIERGIALEPIALAEYNAKTGNASAPCVVVHPEIPYLMASLDGLSRDGLLAVEIKCPGALDHATALDGNIPDKYYPQLQHQLAVIGHQMLHYFSYSSDGSCLIEVQRDDEYIKDMLDKEAAFWGCVQSFSPPEGTDKDFVIRSDDEWKQASSEWLSASASVRESEALEKECRQRLLALSSGQSTVGNGVRVQRVVRKGPVNYTGIPELGGVDLEKYRKASCESWRLSLDK